MTLRNATGTAQGCLSVKRSGCYHPDFWLPPPRRGWRISAVSWRTADAVAARRAGGAWHADVPSR
ncbi:hypothetical protein FMEAI12_4290015 [Parafrankia sp. Ea1.12]|nr:hypothetical protein FMEAI12_4290015 [Parafrankia sp. Ea1.12]